MQRPASVMRMTTPAAATSPEKTRSPTLRGGRCVPSTAWLVMGVAVPHIPVRLLVGHPHVRVRMAHENRTSCWSLIMSIAACACWLIDSRKRR